MNISQRLEKLRQELTSRELDGILVSQPDNRYYLSGFDGSTGYLLITQQDTILATDFRYIEQANEQAHDYQVFQITGNIDNWFPRLVADLDLRRVGFEATHITYAIYRQLSEILKKTVARLRLVPEDGLIDLQRALKEPAEIELIAKAAEISDRAVDYVHDIARAGITEMELAWEAEKFLRDNGSQALPFEVIVASGPNSALPHFRPSKRQIQAGEPILIDIGARFERYCSDISRTFCLGSPDDSFNKIYDIVLGAQMTALSIIKDGMPGDEADSLARTVIEQSGYGASFGHSLGHGVGLAAHEQPRLGPNSGDVLMPGMVFTVEPGIYRSGWGGVRIEDLAVIEKGGIRLLSNAKK